MFSYKVLTAEWCRPENVLASSEFDYYAEFLIKLAQQPADLVGDARLLALLVIQVLLSRLSGAHQTDLAYDALLAILHGPTGSIGRITDAAGEHPEDMKQVIILIDSCHKGLSSSFPHHSL